MKSETNNILKNFGRRCEMMLGRSLLYNWYDYVRKNGLCIRTWLIKEAKFEDVLALLEKKKVSYILLEEGGVAFAFLKRNIVRLYEVRKNPVCKTQKEKRGLEISCYEFKF